MSRKKRKKPAPAVRNEEPAEDAKLPGGIYFSRKSLWLLLATCLLPWAVATWLLIEANRGQAHGNSASEGPSNRFGTAAVSAMNSSGESTGPWGNLRFEPFVIRYPYDWARQDVAFTLDTHWVFPGWNRARLMSFAAKAGLTPEQRQLLSAATPATPQTDVLVVKPSPKLITGLAPEARKAIYQQLAQLTGNDRHAMPTFLPPNWASVWRDEFGIPKEVIDSVRSLIFEYDGAFVFADSNFVLSQIEDIDLRTKTQQALTSRSTMRLFLEINSETELQSIAEYWQGPARNTENPILPLLEAMVERPSPTQLDVVHLLPPFAKERLYRYYNPVTHQGLPPDCFWTSANFFSEAGKTRQYAQEQFSTLIRTQYQRVQSEPRYGDLVLFSQSSGRDAIFNHAAIYIADDILFTKNGRAHYAPWMLASLADVAREYGYPHKPHFVYLRSRM